MAAKIEDYGLIGDTRTAALVSRTGSIDWLCLPHFDSDACLASLLGYDEHGAWSLRPTSSVREARHHYRGNTMVLETEWNCEGGRARVVDFMPPSDQRSDLIRVVEGIEGSVPFDMVINPRFGYGRERPWIHGDPTSPQLTAGADALCLRGTVPLGREDAALNARFEVKKGEVQTFQLSWFPSHLAVPAPLDVARELQRTEGFWTEWADRMTYKGKHRDAVMRSLLTLKALTFAPTGAIVAAPTASLPEEIGGVRNWDYRFCWLRDTTLTLTALMFGGYVEEASRFRDWLLRAVAGDPSQLQIMYSIHGARRLTEFELPWLPGYEGSKPVRVGNAASDQFQLDVYGETLNALYAGRKMGLPEVTEGIETGRALIDHLAEVWQHPDDGIWEVRSGRQPFVYSKVMIWVAVDRAIRIMEEFGVLRDQAEKMLPRLRALRERIHEEVCTRGFNPKLQAFTQSYGSEALDASVLLIPHVGFLPPEDPRVRGTLAAIEKRLTRDGFVLRYSTDASNDGLTGSEGAFLACSFWLADNYAMAGRQKDAEKLFDRLLGLRTGLGLLAEEYEPRLQRQIGNFPQGFSHLALVTTASILEGARPGRMITPDMVGKPKAHRAA